MWYLGARSYIERSFIRERCKPSWTPTNQPFCAFLYILCNQLSWGCLIQPVTKRRGEGILRMEDAMTSEEEDTDSQDFNIATDHSHLARNCLMKIKKPWSQISIVQRNYFFCSINLKEGIHCLKRFSHRVENTLDNGFRSTNLCYKSNTIVTNISSFIIISGSSLFIFWS